MNNPNIVILGAGYGGMMTAVNLQKKLGANQANITLVNENDYHYISTSLHEAAAGTLHQDRARVPIKDVIKEDKVKFVEDRVVSIHPDEKRVVLEDGELSYDVLVVALGFESATFGIPGLEENAFAITDTNSSLLIREQIEYNFAKYKNEKEPTEGRLNFIVGGAGFTGIEFVGELANHIPELCKEYDVDRSEVRVITVEGAPTVMPGFDEALIEYATNSLESRGVEVITGAFLKEAKPDGIVYERNEELHEIKSLTTVWAAGVKANSIVEDSGFETNRGKIQVRGDMRAPDYDDVFVVGDCALIMNEETERPYPPTAQIAVQAADVVAANVEAYIGNTEMHGFEPNLMGTVASLGHNDAIGSILNDRKIFGWKATVMKKVIDNRYYFKLGGIPLLLKKGKFNIFY